MNYITHLNTVFELFFDDNRLSQGHISLYWALFHLWNLNRFKNPILVVRSELMQASKIGSPNTYTRYLKELDQWGYIKYNPSYNPTKPSKIHLYTFDKTGNKTLDNEGVTDVIPFIKTETNNLNLKNKKQDFFKNKSAPAPGHLHSTQLKNYNEPL